MSTIYAFVGTDYITTKGISYQVAFEGLCSTPFKTYVTKHGSRKGRLVHHGETTFEDVDDGIMTTPRYGEGMWLLFQSMLMSRPRTKKVLLERYPQVDYNNALADNIIDYNTIRLASLMARETPAPDVPGFLSHSSVANVMVRRWSLAILEKRPVQGIAELKGSSYVLPPKKGEMIYVEFNVRLGDRKRQRELKQDETSKWIAHFEQQYGESSVSQLQDVFLAPLIEAFHHNGFPKPVTVPFSNIQIDGQARTKDELMEKLRSANGAPKAVHEIFEHTICGVTTFNVKGRGRPLLVNKSTTPRLASRGTPYRLSDVAWDECQQWPVADSIVEKPLVDIFKAIDPEKDVEGVSNSDAIEVLKTLCEYVLDKFASESLPIDEDSDSEEEEDDEEVDDTLELQEEVDDDDGDDGMD